MQSGDHYTWQFKSPPPAAGDPDEATLGLEKAKLSCGPYVVDFIRVLGRALFDDGAHLIKLEIRFP
jgi:hypothetical protein